MPGQPQVVLLGNGDRRVVPGGPALVGADGIRRDLPPKVYEVLELVEAALLEGYAVQVTLLRTELPIDEAADAIRCLARSGGCTPAVATCRSGRPSTSIGCNWPTYSR